MGFWTKIPQVITGVKALSKTGAESVAAWKAKAATTDLKATTRKLNVAMDKAGTAMEKKIKWYQKAANKRRYSKHYYKD